MLPFAMVQAAIGIAPYSDITEWCLETFLYNTSASGQYSVMAKGSGRLVRCSLLEAAAVYCVATQQVGV